MAVWMDSRELIRRLNVRRQRARETAAAASGPLDPLDNADPTDPDVPPDAG